MMRDFLCDFLPSFAVFVVVYLATMFGGHYLFGLGHDPLAFLCLGVSIPAWFCAQVGWDWWRDR